MKEISYITASDIGEFRINFLITWVWIRPKVAILQQPLIQLSRNWVPNQLQLEEQLQSRET